MREDRRVKGIVLALDDAPGVFDIQFAIAASRRRHIGAAMERQTRTSLAQRDVRRQAFTRCGRSQPPSQRVDCKSSGRYRSSGQRSVMAERLSHHMGRRKCRKATRARMRRKKDRQRHLGREANSEYVNLGVARCRDGDAGGSDQPRVGTWRLGGRWGRRTGTAHCGCPPTWHKYRDLHPHQVS